MKKVLFAFLLSTPALAWAAKPQPNPADYTIAVHVERSRMPMICVQGLCYFLQDLDVVIDGKKIELESGRVMDLLRVGDYKAKIVKDETAQPYEYNRVYEFLFTDGKTRTYSVVGEQE